ncbi:vomeronasal type-2 receptor 26-like [Mantella aurantiaca]
MVEGQECMKELLMVAKDGTDFPKPEVVVPFELEAILTVCCLYVPIQERRTGADSDKVPPKNLEMQSTNTPEIEGSCTRKYKRKTHVTLSGQCGGHILHRYVRTLHSYWGKKKKPVFDKRGEIPHRLELGTLAYYESSPGQYNVWGQYVGDKLYLEKETNPEELSQKFIWKRGSRSEREHEKSQVPLLIPAWRHSANLQSGSEAERGETMGILLEQHLARFWDFLWDGASAGHSSKYRDIPGKIGTMADARCNDVCLPGYRKAPSPGIHACCYHCVPCSDGEISNVTDIEICQKCPDDQLPDKKKVKCIPKTYEYLSYEMDIMTQAFSIITVFFSGVTLYTLTLFILFRDTPIVKASNRTVSFILLAATLLSFLCVFLFLGRPVDITCMMRQISFGIFFSIAVSCVLAKTFTVCIAFKASKPGSSWRKWVGEKTSNSVVLICSSVQVVICVTWLSVSPPYQEYDLHSYPGKIIIQCNEGSVIGFYSVLGYMGFLAAVSFVLAFMVRTLPDSFNEAKYITFSMLVFCSVWIAMIPAYLSTRGKYMVAVEVFAILASSAGLIFCIFFPKYYIIIIKPERNSRKCILDKVKS